MTRIKAIIAWIKGLFVHALDDVDLAQGLESGARSILHVATSTLDEAADVQDRIAAVLLAQADEARNTITTLEARAAEVQSSADANRKLAASIRELVS